MDENGNEFKPINRWPKKNLHLRNIEMSLEIVKGKTYREVASLYRLTENRVMQLHRIMVAKIYERYFGIPFARVVDEKECYNHKDMKRMLEEYHRRYISWLVSGENK